MCNIVTAAPSQACVVVCERFVAALLLSVWFSSLLPSAPGTCCLLRAALYPCCLLPAACCLLRDQTASSASSIVGPAFDRVSSLLPPVTDLVPKGLPDLDQARSTWNRGVISARDLVVTAVDKVSEGPTTGK